MHKVSDWILKSYSRLINPDVEILNQYTGAKSKMECRCVKCGTEFISTHYRLLNTDNKYNRSARRRKRLCPNPNCDASVFPEKYPPVNTLELLFTIQENAKEKYIMLDYFESIDKEIRCQCVQCHHEWEETPKELKKARTKCPSCGNKRGVDWKRKKIIDEYNGEFDIEVYGVSGLKCHCKKCDCDFVVKSYKNTISCPECRTNNRNERKKELFSKGLTSVHKPEHCMDSNVQRGIITRTLTGYDPDCILYYSRAEFVELVRRITPNIVILDENIDSSKKVRCKCKTCNSEWSTWVHYLTRGAPCPKCKGSAGERAVATYLDDNDIEYIREYSFDDCRDKMPLRFDFYLPEKNAVIEFDGIQHFMPVSFVHTDDRESVAEQFRGLQKRDENKNKYCLRKGVHMLRIRYDEKNIAGVIEDFLNKIDK